MTYVLNLRVCERQRFVYMSYVLVCFKLGFPMGWDSPGTKKNPCPAVPLSLYKKRPVPLYLYLMTKFLGQTPQSWDIPGQNHYLIFLLSRGSCTKKCLFCCTYVSWQKFQDKLLCPGTSRDKITTWFSFGPVDRTGRSQPVSWQDLKVPAHHFWCCWAKGMIEDEIWDFYRIFFLIQKRLPLTLKM